MTTITRQRFTDDQIQSAKQADLLALAEQYTELRKASTNEYKGPCPECGGTDRFHVHATEGWFFCRKCHPKKGDVIEFVQWMHDLTFPEAVEQLIGALPALPAPHRRPAQRHPAHCAPTAPSADFGVRCKAKLSAAIDALHNGAVGQPGRDYLQGRSLGPDVWRTFRLGYAPTVKVPGSDEYAPAIAIPWYDMDGTLAAIRYRFLEAHGPHKITSERGSTTSGRLFGWQAMPQGYDLPIADGYVPVENHCWLLVVEGEINAMSAYEATKDSRLDVLSIGSESSHLSDSFIQFAQRYGRVLVWTDKKEVAAQLRDQLSNTFAVCSPEGQDANDLHQLGLLRGFLAVMREKAARSDEEAQRLYYALWDAAYYDGLDATTAAVCNRLGARIGRTAALVETTARLWRPEISSD